eukprot:SAG31_NODE_3064_length_4732_cov_4.692833_2_plen_202_part_00
MAGAQHTPAVVLPVSVASLVAFGLALWATRTKQRYQRPHQQKDDRHHLSQVAQALARQVEVLIEKGELRANARDDLLRGVAVLLLKGEQRQRAAPVRGALDEAPDCVRAERVDILALRNRAHGPDERRREGPDDHPGGEEFHRTEQRDDGQDQVFQPDQRHEHLRLAVAEACRLPAPSRARAAPRSVSVRKPKGARLSVSH